MTILPDEVVLKALGGEVRGDRAEIEPGPGRLDRPVVDIGREYLDRAAAVGPGHSLPEKDSNRIRFLTRRAAGDPDPDRIGPVRIHD